MNNLSSGIDTLMHFCLHTEKSPRTGFAPFELLYGRTVRGPMQILKELWTKDVDDPEVKISYQYVFELRDKLDSTLKLAQEGLAKSQRRYKHYFDRKARVRKFKEGDLVLVLLPTDNNKLLMQWKGPYKIESVFNRNDYRVNVKGKTKTYHANLLKQYLQRGEDERSAEQDDQNDGHLFDVAAAAVIQPEPPIEEDTVDDENLLELHGCIPKETYLDVQYGQDLAQEQIGELKALVNEFGHVFSDVPGNTDLISHRIKLTSEEPVRSKPYPIPYNIRDELKKDIAEMVKLGVIRKSESPYAAPVVIVRKKDGSNRVCIDFRKLNKLTVFDPEPMVTVNEVLSRLSKDKVFTKIDLAKGYWQIPVVEEDIHKTAFVTPDGTYEFLKMPFGMMNSGATFVRAMRKMLSGMDCVENFIDDILVHTPTFERHIEVLRELFERFEKHQIKARPTKCSVGADNVDFLGHQISQGELGLHEDNIAKIRNAPRPMTKKQVRAFIGLTGFYRNFVPNYAAIAVPLTDLTKKGLPNFVEWEESQEKAFVTLKTYLTSKPILRLPDVSKPFVLRTDASDIGVGAILLQTHDDVPFPVSYASKKLSPRERNYSTIERECLAIVWGVKKFNLYLEGKEFTLQTDHQPLIYLNRAKFDNDRIMRWAMFLQNYRMTFESIKGSDNVGADYLSRI